MQFSRQSCLNLCLKPQRGRLVYVQSAPIKPLSTDPHRTPTPVFCRMVPSGRLTLCFAQTILKFQYDLSMKLLSTFIFVLLAGTAFGQSTPACQVFCLVNETPLSSNVNVKLRYEMRLGNWGNANPSTRMKRSHLKRRGISNSLI
jgi:hypothetical protein